MRKVLRWARSHPWRAAGLFLLAAFVALNVLAYRHAHAFTHFVPNDGAAGGGWRGQPESLSPGEKTGALFNGVAIARPRHDARPADVGLAFEGHAFDGEAGRLEAWYLPHPQARGVVLLFHGFGSCKARLLPEARALHELGHACFLVDFRACGDSEGEATTVGYCEADDVARAAAYVRQKWPGPLVLFGQSMGSAAVLRAVGVLGVEADAVVLECPFDRMLGAVRARFRAMGVPPFLSAELLVFWGGAQHGFNGFRHDPVEYARGVRCPALLLHGQRDARVSRAEVEAVHENLAGAKALYVFEGLGHES
jgi:pimeloyl-ACP methyl ester carboxylesterase